jgi:hypothetical protein
MARYARKPRLDVKVRLGGARWEGSLGVKDLQGFVSNFSASTREHSALAQSAAAARFDTAVMITNDDGLTDMVGPLMSL